MVELDQDTKNIVMGTVLGCVAGVGASLLCTKYWNGNRKEPIHTLTRTICQISDAMDNVKKSGKPLVQETEQFLHKKESALSSVAGLVVEGMKLWQRFKN